MTGKDFLPRMQEEVNFLPVERTYYWWLDEVDKDPLQPTLAPAVVDLQDTMHRQGPGILLLRKPGIF